MKILRATGIEPTYRAWEARVLPLNYARVSRYCVGIYTHFAGFVKLKITCGDEKTGLYGRIPRIGKFMPYSFNQNTLSA